MQGKTDDIFLEIRISRVFFGTWLPRFRNKQGRIRDPESDRQPDSRARRYIYVGLGLCNMKGKTIICGRELPSGGGRRRRSSKLRHDTLESHSYLCRSRRRRSEVASGPRRTLPALLASHLLVRLPARPFRAGRAGSHPGFFCYDAGR